MRMKLRIEQIIERHANDKYCPYCISSSMGRIECCGERDHWIKLRDFDDDTQWRLAEEIAKEGKDQGESDNA